VGTGIKEKVKTGEIKRKMGETQNPNQKVNPGLSPKAIGEIYLGKTRLYN